jgi:chitinase
VPAKSGVVSFPAGVTSRTLAVPVVGDTVREADETFSVLLSLPTNAGIGDGTGVGTVRNDD